MNKIEAIKSMLDGEKVRMKYWGKNEYVYLDEEGDFVDESGKCLNMDDYGFHGWEIYKPKKKKDLYLFAVKKKNSNRWEILTHYYEDEEYLNLCNSPFVEESIRLDWSKITVEVEEENEDDK